MKKHLIPNRPQLVKENVVADISNKVKLSLYKKSTQSGIATNILEEVYRRGLSTWNESFKQTPEQFSFDRVNSFIAGGFAVKLDADLLADQVNNIRINETNETKAQLVKRVINEMCEE
jgi:hypothetical protein